MIAWSSGGIDSFEEEAEKRGVTHISLIQDFVQLIKRGTKINEVNLATETNFLSTIVGLIEFMSNLMTGDPEKIKIPLDGIMENIKSMIEGPVETFRVDQILTYLKFLHMIGILGKNFADLPFDQLASKAASQYK